MNAGTASERSEQGFETSGRRTWRTSAFVVSLVLLLFVALPPISIWARRYEFVEALQFVVLVAVVPALFVNGAPWRLLRLSSSSRAQVESVALSDLDTPGPIDRIASRRLRHREPIRSVGVLLVYGVITVFWRIPFAVDALARHPWLLVVEVLTVPTIAIVLWTELVDSPPLSPRLVRPYRIALGAVSMWLIWILAYFVALSHGVWYHAYHHHRGVGISLVADQQLTAGVMWIISGIVYISLIYRNLYRWLQSEEDPNEELHQLIRFERIRRGASKASGLSS